MFFHLAPTKRWNAELLHQNFLRFGLDATIVKGNVHLEVNSERCDAVRQHHARRIARRRAAGHAATEPHLAIRHYPDRFVRNLELYRDQLMVPASEPAVTHAREAIDEWNVIVIDSLETEFDIAYRNCTDTEAVRQFCDQIQRCEQDKRSSVDELDFHTAKDAYDRANELRAQLDALLLGHS